MPAMAFLAILFTAAVAHTVHEKDAPRGDVFVEMGAADMAVHRSGQSTMMRRESDVISLADIKKHDAGRQLPLTNNTAYHQALLDSNPAIVCTFERDESTDSHVVCKGEACGGSVYDRCDLNGEISGTPEQLDGLVPENTEQRSMYFDADNEGFITIPDHQLLTSSSTGFPNRTVSFFFNLPELTGNHDPKILYCQGDAALGGLSIYYKETTCDGGSRPCQFVHMFAWDHENQDGNSEFGTLDVGTQGIRCPELNEAGGTYWVAFNFRQRHDGHHVVYDGRIWKHGWMDAKHCGTADGHDNVTLPNNAKIPRTGHELGEIKLGGIGNADRAASCRVDGTATGTLNVAQGSSGYHCNCTMDEVAIYNRPLSDAELWKTPTGTITGQLCHADSLMHQVCADRAHTAAANAAADDPLAGNR